MNDSLKMIIKLSAYMTNRDWINESHKQNFLWKRVALKLHFIGTYRWNNMGSETLT